MGAEKLARSLVVMVAAGGAMDDVLELAKAQGVRAVHVEQLAVPEEEHQSRLWLIAALKGQPRLSPSAPPPYAAFPTDQYVWCAHGVPQMTCETCQGA